jgi:hypothetical protein
MVSTKLTFKGPGLLEAWPYKKAVETTKYIQTLTKSCKIVLTGPLAFAGSFFSFMKIKGIKNPVKIDETTVANDPTPNIFTIFMSLYEIAPKAAIIPDKITPSKSTIKKCLRK